MTYSINHTFFDTYQAPRQNNLQAGHFSKNAFLSFILRGSITGFCSFSRHINSFSSKNKSCLEKAYKNVGYLIPSV